MDMKKKSAVQSVLLFVFYVIVVIITLLPLALLAVSSLRPGSELMRNGLNFNLDWAAAMNSDARICCSCVFCLL